MSETMKARFGIMKGTKLFSGDGWKDTGKKGDTCFVYVRPLPPPYAPGQFPCVGQSVMAASAEDHKFERPSLLELLRLLPAIIRDRRESFYWRLAYGRA